MKDKDETADVEVLLMQLGVKSGWLMMLQEWMFEVRLSIVDVLSDQALNVPRSRHGKAGNAANRNFDGSQDTGNMSDEASESNTRCTFRHFSRL